MLEKIKNLMSANKNDLSVGLSVSFIAIFVFSPISDVIRDHVSKSEPTIPTIGIQNNNTTIGIPFKQYKEDLKQREQEISAKLTIKHHQEKTALQHELSAIQQQQYDLKQSYQQHIAKLKARIKDLAQFKEYNPNYAVLLENAIKQLTQGNTQKADELLATIEEDNADTIKIVAKASFQRAKIAQDDIRYQDALKHYQKAHNLAPENTLYLNRLGMMFYTLGKYDKAIEYYELALKRNLVIYGEAHPSVASLRNNLGRAWKASGKYNKAIKHYELALKSSLKVYGKAHPSVAICRNNLGGVWMVLGKYNKAIEYVELALKSNLATYGKTHPSVAINRNNLGMAWKALGKYKKAIEYYELALESSLETYRETHPQVATYRNNLGMAWKALGKYNKAIEYLELALKSDLATYGERHPDVAIRRNNLGGAWLALGEYNKAIEHLELALATFKRVLGGEHPNTKNAQEGLNRAKNKYKTVSNQNYSKD